MTNAYPGSKIYWDQRYTSGGNSGAGSYNQFAEFKANTINKFVKNNNINKVIEYGCGDGNQLRLAEYNAYLGFDVSPKAIELCNNIFKDDKTKEFKLLSDYNGEIADLTLSLDVIYHLIEDDIYNEHMELLFGSSEKFVIIYSTNFNSEQNGHQRHRAYAEWIVKRQEWELILSIAGPQQLLTNFSIYSKNGDGHG